MHEQVILFNKTIQNIFNNFIPNKLFTCDDKDPPWINDEIKTLIKRKKLVLLGTEEISQCSL